MSSEVPTNVDEARGIAVAAFKKSTSNEITHYSVELVHEDSEVWKFLIEGTGEYARPGFHWAVTVYRGGGSTKVLRGE